MLGHSDVAPGRKVDPGELFPWQRLHEAGVGHWVAPAATSDGRFFSRGDQGMPIEALQAMLVMYGYGLKINGVFDEDTEKVVAAFQRHFRPERVDGVADASTITTLRNLIATRPVGPAHDKELTRNSIGNRPQSPLMTFLVLQRVLRCGALGCG